MRGRLPNVLEKGQRAYFDERATCPRTHHEENDPRADRMNGVLFVRDGYRAVVCDHGEHPPDFCSSCAPLWGVKAVRVIT